MTEVLHVAVGLVSIMTASLRVSLPVDNGCCWPLVVGTANHFKLQAIRDMNTTWGTDGFRLSRSWSQCIDGLGHTAV